MINSSLTPDNHFDYGYVWKATSGTERKCILYPFKNLRESMDRHPGCRNITEKEIWKGASGMETMCDILV